MSQELNRIGVKVNIQAVLETLFKSVYGNEFTIEVIDDKHLFEAKSIEKEKCNMLIYYGIEKTKFPAMTKKGERFSPAPYLDFKIIVKFLNDDKEACETTGLVSVPVDLSNCTMYANLGYFFTMTQMEMHKCTHIMEYRNKKNTKPLIEEHSLEIIKYFKERLGEYIPRLVEIYETK